MTKANGDGGLVPFRMTAAYLSRVMLRFAIGNLLSRPVRSILSWMGLTVAIAGMVGLFSVAEGIDRLMTSTFGRIPGLIAIQPGSPIPLFSRLPAAWQPELEQVEGVSVVTAEIWQRVNVVNRQVVLSPPRFLFGTDIPSRLKLRRSVYQQDMVSGRFLTPDDKGTFNTVISQQIADQYKVDVGEQFVVNGYKLTVVGVYDCGSLLLDVAIILDIDQVRRMTRFGADSVCAFYIEQDEGIDADALASVIRERFRDHALATWKPSSMTESASGLTGLLSRLGNLLKPSESAAGSNGETTQSQIEPQSQIDPIDDLMQVDEMAPIEVRSAVEWASRFERLNDDLNIILTILTSIGVSIAVLSIVNTMLMSVSERMVEFGILKANGWTRGDIMKLIGFESAIIGVLGGLAGSLAGWIGTLIVSRAWPMQAQLYASPGLLVFSIFFSIAMGLLGGLYPAIRAMRMMPMQALRRG